MWSVVGHDAVVEAMSRSIENGRLAHAYLFVGPPGIGKRTLALDLAAALQCAGASESCRRRVFEGKHPDVMTIRVTPDEDGRTRKAIAIEQIEEMQRTAGLRSFEGRWRVFIIDGAEDLSLDAANRLLKTLEEPPASVLMVLLAADEHSVLPTVLSRCWVHRLQPVSRRIIEETLTARFGVEVSYSRLLASVANGRMGWAIEAVQDGRIMERRSEQVAQIIQLAGDPDHDRIALAARLADGYRRDREVVHEWVRLFIEWWRDVLLVHEGRTELVNIDRRDILEQVAQGCGLNDAVRVLKRAQATLDHLDRNANPRLALDVLVLEAPRIRGIRHPEPEPSKVTS